MGTKKMKEQLHSQWYALQLDWEKNILAVFRSANADQITEGKRWYPKAIEMLTFLGNSSRLAIDSQRLAAICAVLSPRITWQSNIEGVRRILRAIYLGQSLVPTVAGVRRNVDKAWDIANNGSLDQVTGPKVTAFYANLQGNLQRVTIDVWAARAAGITDEAVMNHLDRYRYVYLERAYQIVAKELGFAPAELQAICWIVVRGKGE
jgi:hypothetical protein